MEVAEGCCVPELKAWWVYAANSCRKIKVVEGEFMSVVILHTLIRSGYGNPRILSLISKCLDPNLQQIPI